MAAWSTSLTRSAIITQPAHGAAIGHGDGFLLGLAACVSLCAVAVGIATIIQLPVSLQHFSANFLLSGEFSVSVDLGLGEVPNPQVQLGS